MATTEAEIKLLAAEVGAQVKARTAPGGLNTWGKVDIAIIPKNGPLPSPLPTGYGIVVELDT